MLLCWLQSTLSRSFVSCILGCIHSCQLWDKVHDYFHKQTRARVQKLCSKFCSMTLDDRSMGDFLLKIKYLVDCLALIGDPTFFKNTLMLFLKGCLKIMNMLFLLLKVSLNLSLMKKIKLFFLHMSCWESKSRSNNCSNTS